MEDSVIYSIFGKTAPVDPIYPKNYTCIICNACFQTKRKYDSHYIWCNFCHTSKKEKDFDPYAKIYKSILEIILEEIKTTGIDMKKIQKMISVSTFFKFSNIWSVKKF